MNHITVKNIIQFYLKKWRFIEDEKSIFFKLSLLKEKNINN